MTKKTILFLYNMWKEKKKTNVRKICFFGMETALTEKGKKITIKAAVDKVRLAAHCTTVTWKLRRKRLWKLSIMKC